MKKLLDSLTPFLAFGFALAIFFVILTLFFHILFWGLIIGVVIWAIALIHQLITGNNPFTEKKQSKSSKGRIIEHDDN